MWFSQEDMNNFPKKLCGGCFQIGVFYLFLFVLFIYTQPSGGGGAPQQMGSGVSSLSAFHIMVRVGHILALTQTPTQTTPGADGSIGEERSGKQLRL